ncbi:uncharacterized protein K460DRAFT_399891 [Cucurbitaria berberidis CBS 394.84]|uniref:Uncharacterized protein n=1 Tax=Cucurbitaria berberidis CBS 394.84 TaxID=1168544 RepID=A0A9P4GQC8_9PLEO|nr:uncharacterized protein K460DRAFT_399891 [Cucurbitaria berberidis CBS 394.84]KAF1849780.1 hypothetical protein K460DRAFT_399891 [Cucurbitaria berberidis CBS 394.84]
MSSTDTSYAFVLMTLTRPIDTTPFPPAITEPWQGQPEGVWKYNLSSSDFLRLKMWRLRDDMRKLDVKAGSEDGTPNGAFLSIDHGEYKLVGGGEPMWEFNIVVGKDRVNDKNVKRLYWVEKAAYTQG